MVLHSSNPGILEAEVGRSGIQGHPLLCIEFKVSLGYETQTQKQNKDRYLKYLSQICCDD